MPVTPVTYSQRLHAFKPMKTWTVEPGGLRWADKDKDTNQDAATGFIGWTDITSVRLRFEPSRAERRRTALHVYTPIDHAITNINYRGPLNFELQQDEFRAFVDAFHAGAAGHANIAFHKGSTMGAYIGNILIIVFTILLLLLVSELVVLTGVPGLTTIVRIGIILLLAPTLIKLIKRNKPATYMPEDWPKDMLA